MPDFITRRRILPQEIAPLKIKLQVTICSFFGKTFLDYKVRQKQG